jgi:DNA-directed RNA polymerase subunit RPC12/RpoP
MPPPTIAVKLTKTEKCLNCGHTWRPVKSPVVRCPKCKNRYWYMTKYRRPKPGRPPKGKEEA